MCPTAQAPPRPSSHQTKAYICLTHARKLSEGHTTDKMACSPLPSVPLMCQPLSWMPLRQKQGLGHGYAFEIKVKVFKSLSSDLEPTSPPPKGSASCRMEATSILIQGDKRSQQAAGAWVVPPLQSSSEPGCVRPQLTSGGGRTAACQTLAQSPGSPGLMRKPAEKSMLA